MVRVHHPLLYSSNLLTLPHKAQTKQNPVRIGKDKIMKWQKLLFEMAIESANGCNQLINISEKDLYIQKRNIKKMRLKALRDLQDAYKLLNGLS